MVRGPFGILNLIVLGPPAASALRIAWRSEPGPESAVVLTTSDPLTVRLVANGDVPVAAEVAVAVTVRPETTATLNDTLNVAVPPFPVRGALPRKIWA